jgi:hypothetical protein
MSSKILHTLVIENRGDTPPGAHAICLVLLSDWYSEIVHRLHKLQCYLRYHIYKLSDSRCFRTSGAS